MSATNPRPNTTSYTWVSATESDEVVAIATTDPNYAPPPASYAIGVYGYAGNVSFTVLAQMDGTNVTAQLTDGVPQAGLAQPHNFAYFSFQLPKRFPVGVPHPGLDFAAIPVAGDCDIYVSNLTTVVNGVTVPVFPQPKCLFYGRSGICFVYGVDNSTYTWSSAQQGSKNFISLPPSSIYANESFVVGVLATTFDPLPGQLPPPTLFSVIASTGLAVMDLPMGQQVPGSVTAPSTLMPARYKNYRVTATAWGMDIVINGARTSSGNINIFAAEGFLPTASNFTWSTKTTGFMGDRYVYIPFMNLSYSCQMQLYAGAPCSIFVSVLGTGPAGTECLYKISAQVSGSQVYPFVITDGTPIYAFVPAHAYEYFYGAVNVPPYRSIYVVVQNLVGSTTLYLNIGNTTKTFWVAGGPDPDVVVYDMGGYERVDIFPPGQYPFFRGARGSIMAVTDDGAGSLFGTAALPAGASPADARAHAGPTAMESPQPRLIARMPSGDLVFEVPLEFEEEPVLDGGVEVARRRRYSSEATRVSPSNLAADPSRDSVLARKFRAAREAEAEARARGVDMTPVIADRSAVVDGVAPPFPPRHTDLWCTGCLLFMTVAASVDSQIAVSFTAGAVYQTLMDSIPMEGMSPRGDFSFFAFAATDPTQDVTISLQQIFGNTDVFIAVQVPIAPNFMPGHFNNQWQMVRRRSCRLCTRLPRTPIWLTPSPFHFRPHLSTPGKETTRLRSTTPTRTSAARVTARPPAPPASSSSASLRATMRRRPSPSRRARTRSPSRSSWTGRPWRAPCSRGSCSTFPS